MPKGRSMTRAPCVTAYRIPAAAVATERGPEPPTVTGKILARGAMPTVPVPAPVPIPWPAIITAIAVPWPSSPTWMSVSPLRAVPVRSAPGSTTPRRSGTLAWTPLSTSATVTPAPWDSGHTFRCTCQAANHHSPGPGASRAGVPAAPAGPASAAPAWAGAAHRGSAHSASRPAAGADSRRHTPLDADSRRHTPLDTDGLMAPAHRPRAGKEPVTIREP
jgi:hypothetical protein